MISKWYTCGLAMMHDAGLTGNGHWDLPLLYKRHSVRKDGEFLELVQAVIRNESNFSARVVSGAAAYGLMQVTRVAALDAAAYCNLRPIGSMDELLDSATNVRYGSCYLMKVLDENGGDMDRAIINYNGGLRQVEKYLRGESIASETAQYVVRVRKSLNMCRSK